MRPLLAVEGISKTYLSGERRVVALDDVSFTLDEGRTLGLVGASGCGKSTLARILLRLLPADAGRVRFMDEDWLDLSGQRLRAMRRHIQMVFQDTHGAFNPRATVGSVLADPLRIHDIVERRRQVIEIGSLLERVDLPAGFAARPILELSGGQRQRVAIARVLATRPRLIVLDEAVSALDVSVRGKILELLVDLQAERNLAYMFVSHDLAVVRAISHHVAVMDAGRIVEAGPAASLVASPQSAALQALVAAVPRLAISAPSVQE